MGQLPTQTYHTIEKDRANFDYLRNKLKIKKLQESDKFQISYPLAHEFLKGKGLDLGKIREHSSKLIGAAVMSGSLLLTPPSSFKSLPAPHEIIEKFRQNTNPNLKSSHDLIVETLASVIPKRARPLSRVEEKLIEQVFQNVIGVTARATLEGEHLNTTYGYIGAEQHLRRYPGDKISDHGEGKVLKEGIAPGLGAWGYFTGSRESLSESDIEREKWYAVVQTLYLPDWDRRQPFLKSWYKYRKVLIVNTNNGNAVVATIADSGPAAWTGKHYGGSPEVMAYLGGERDKKGPVIVFFVDDPENKMPLGPVEYNNMTLAGGLYE